MCDKEYQTPYIPLSWLRAKRKWVRLLYTADTQITVHDVWLWIVRQEISRLTIEELEQKIRELEK